MIRHLEPYISAASELIITMERALAALPELARRFETYSSALLFDGIPQYLLYEEAASRHVATVADALRRSRLAPAPVRGCVSRFQSRVRTGPGRSPRNESKTPKR